MSWLKNLASVVGDVVSYIAGPIAKVVNTGIDYVAGTASKKQDLKNSKQMADYNANLSQQQMAIQQGYNTANMEKQSDLALRNFAQQFAMENARQDELNLNAASTQVESLKRAGLNPIMAMQGEFSGNVANPSASMPSSQTPIGSALGSLVNSGFSHSQQYMLHEQIEGIKANNQVLKEQANLLRVEADGKEKDNEFKEDWWNNSLLLQKSEIKFNDKQSSKIENDILDSLDRLQLDIDKNEQEIAESVSRIEHMAFQNGLLDSQTLTEDLNRYWLPRVLGARIALDYSQKRLNDWEASEAWSNIQEVSQRIRNLKSELKLTDAEVEEHIQSGIRAKLENEGLEKIPPAVRYVIDKAFGLFDIAGIVYGVRSATKPKSKRVRTRTDRYQQSNGDIGTITTEVTDYH